jgi:hypothetical protein
MYMATVRLQLPNIARLAIYSATSEYNYVQTLPNIVVPLYKNPPLAFAVREEALVVIVIAQTRTLCLHFQEKGPLLSSSLPTTEEPPCSHLQ